MVPPYAGKDFIKHVMHAASLLDNNGVLIAVIPQAVFESVSFTAQSFRRWLRLFTYDTVPMGKAVCNYPVPVVILTVINNHPQQVDYFEEELKFGYGTMS